MLRKSTILIAASLAVLLGPATTANADTLIGPAPTGAPAEAAQTNEPAPELRLAADGIVWAGPYNSSWQCWLAYPIVTRNAREIVDACSQHTDNWKWWIGVRY